MQFKAKIETFANGRTVQPGEIVNLPFDPEWPEAWEALDTGHDGVTGIGLLKAEGQKTEAETHEGAADVGESSSRTDGDSNEAAANKDGDAETVETASRDEAGAGSQEADAAQVDAATKAIAPPQGTGRGRTPKPRNT